MTQPLHGRRIFVTGGVSGIGAAAVQVLSEAGAGNVATYHRTPPAEHAGVKWVQCDVRDAGAVDDMVKGAAETHGGLDVLLHAAGLWQPGIPGQITGEDIDFLVDTNLRATIFTNQAAYAVMGKDGGGRIINFGSVTRRPRRLPPRTSRKRPVWSRRWTDGSSPPRSTSAITTRSGPPSTAGSSNSVGWTSSSPTQASALSELGSTG